MDQIENYQSNLIATLSAQRRNKEFVDMDIISSNGISHANRAIINFHPFWHDLLQDRCQEKYTTVIIPDYELKFIEDWLDNLYAHCCIDYSSQAAVVPEDVSNEDIENSPNFTAAAKARGNYQRRCEHCSKLFKNPKTYWTHALGHKPENWKHKCEQCRPSQSFMTKRHLMIHLSKVHDQQASVCKQCGKSYSTDANLNQHVKTSHQYSLYTCEQCGKVFKSKMSLRDHLKGHKNDASQFRTCQQCGKTFRGRYYYQHRKTHDPSQWKFQCQLCQDKFMTQSKLTEHQSLVHTGLAKFPCDQCHQMFLTQGRRSLHKKTCT